MISWHWVFPGATSQGSEREILWQTGRMALNQRQRIRSADISEFCLLRLAHIAASSDLNTSSDKSFARADWKKGMSRCSRIRQRLIGVLRRQLDQLRLYQQRKGQNGRNDRGIATTDNALTNDFFCQVCRTDLSNMHLHCKDCEERYSHSFNICIGCYVAGDHRSSQHTHLVSPSNWDPCLPAGEPSDAVKGGPFTKKNKRAASNKAPCLKSGSNDKVNLGCYCGTAQSEACSCHTNFVLEYRLWSEQDLQCTLRRLEMGTSL
mmetsp:Transcript_17212/g.47676  ORF Transcript_17212/g.47676 Transcript_17212/m.47676 type:complete len:263 (-) Transcript_17212:1506-2294(-)